MGRSDRRSAPTRHGRLKQKWTPTIVGPMGAWGTGIYDNDDAADWAFRIPEEGLDVVREALQAALRSEYVDAIMGSHAIAAADVVARLVSGIGVDSPYCAAVTSWVAEQTLRPEPLLIELSVRALARVRAEESELAELWNESDALGAWQATLDDTFQRLKR